MSFAELEQLQANMDEQLNRHIKETSRLQSLVHTANETAKRQLLSTSRANQRVTALEAAVQETTARCDLLAPELLFLQKRVGSVSRQRQWLDEQEAAVQDIIDDIAVHHLPAWEALAALHSEENAIAMRQRDINAAIDEQRRAAALDDEESLVRERDQAKEALARVTSSDVFCARVSQQAMLRDSCKKLTRQLQQRGIAP